MPCGIIQSKLIRSTIRYVVIHSKVHPVSPAPPTSAPLPNSRLHVIRVFGSVSDLAFRLQCRKYGAELVYSEMLDSAQYVADLQYRYY